MYTNVTSILSYEDAVDLRNRYIGKSCSLFYRDDPLKIVRAYKQYMYDDKGNEYLDCINNVAHVGHCHPLVVQSECHQAATLCTNSRFLHDNMLLYAQKLVSLFPPSLSVCFFVNSGSEANDLALQLAQCHTQAGDVITVDDAYHGHLIPLVAISPYKYKQRKFYNKPDWVHVASVPDTYNGRYRRQSDDENTDFGLLYAKEVENIIKNVQIRNRKIAAFIAESLLSCAGQILLPSNYLRNVYQYVREAGGVCIADEVQVGFGRVGTHWWAFQLQGEDVIPDIVTLGKPMGNGHPISAVVTTAAIADSFYKAGGGYFNTFGGNPVSCAIALSVLHVIESEDLMKNAYEVGIYILDLLNQLQIKHEIIGDVRGIGLFIGIELVRDRVTKEPAITEAKTVCDLLKKNFIIVSRDGLHGNILKLKPPMVFTKQNANIFIEKLDNILSNLIL
ncbi:hypothetical protein PGB90_006159 [Kerria lacca]